jgi:hypothetical protein
MVCVDERSVFDSNKPLLDVTTLFYNYMFVMAPADGHGSV